MNVNVAYDFHAKRSSCRSQMVMDHFGIGFETGPHLIAEDLELPIQAGDVVCFTGASGTGKSSVLRAVADSLKTTGQCVLNLDELSLGEAVLIDALDLPVAETMGILAACGLSEARLLLRTPAELSEGQRFRFRLALAVSKQPDWIVVDEFSSSLDRVLAKVVAFNLRRLADRLGTGFLLATTHTDILADLAPSLHVDCRQDGTINVIRPNKEPSDARKKNGRSASPANSNSRPARQATGRISLGGIIDRTTSASSNSSRCSGMATNPSGSV